MLIHLCISILAYAEVLRHREVESVKIPNAHAPDVRRALAPAVVGVIDTPEKGTCARTPGEAGA